MSDYTKATDFAAKDLLATGNANKVVKGTEIDDEYNLLATAVNSKFDVTDKNVANGLCPLDAGSLVPVANLPNIPAVNLPVATESAIGALEIATLAETDTGTSDLAIVTPLKLQSLLDSNAGLLEDFKNLASPGADRIIFWDNGAGGAAFLIAGNGLNISGTTIIVDSATTTVDGIAELATNTEVNTGSDTSRIVTPSGLAQATSLLQATATQRGAAEIATQAEVDAGSDTARYVTPETLASATTTGAKTANKIKTSDETINSDTTFSADAALTGLTMDSASSHYELTGTLRVTSSVAADFKLKFVWSNNPTDVAISVTNITVSGGQNVDATTTATNSMRFDHGGSTVQVYQIRGVFKTASTPGNFALHWAQETLNAAATTVHAGSYLKITKLT